MFDRKAYMKEWNKKNYATNRTKEIARVKASPYYKSAKKSATKKTWAGANVIKNTIKILEHFKENPCVDCGCEDPLVLHFDHVRGRKVDAVSNLIRFNTDWDIVYAEIQKCEVRCANCHLKRHAIKRNSRLYRLVLEQNDRLK